MLTIRAADNSDQPDAVALVNAVLLEYGLEPDPGNIDADLLDIRANYSAAGGLFVLLEDDAGRTVGTAGLMKIDDRTCELRKMYFTPAIRGQGWGTAVLDYLVRKAGEMGFERMQLETATVLREAIALYTRAGFKTLPSHQGAVRCDRAYYLTLEEYRTPDRLRMLNVRS